MTLEVQNFNQSWHELSEQTQLFICLTRRKYALRLYVLSYVKQIYLSWTLFDPNRKILDHHPGLVWTLNNPPSPSWIGLHNPPSQSWIGLNFEQSFITILDWFKQSSITILVWFEQSSITILDWFEQSSITTLDWFESSKNNLTLLSL